jgi:peptidyl-prolyl cis-trans isomerase SDCCAG10
MSNIYHTEPPTHGKVLLKTSQGDLDIELWSKEAPLACRNFVQLCMEGYYDNCPIHRVIKEFMVQTGDPTGTGQGGESIWGRPFKDEIHGRIKFNHRGQVAMANENKPNSNHSQFFMTLGPCDWIDRKHTIFGKVTGNTVYNLVRFNEVEVDSSDRPVDKIFILKTEVLWNPFDDIIPRCIRSFNYSLS